MQFIFSLEILHLLQFAKSQAVDRGKSACMLFKEIVNKLGEK